MKKIKIILLGILLSANVFGQFGAANLGYDLTRLVDNVQFANSFELDSVAGFGSGKFQNKRWFLGLCKINDTLQLEAFYNIDLYNDKLLYTLHLDSVSRTASHPYTFKEVIIDKKVFQYLDYKDGIISGKGFFEVLESGNTKLLLRTEIIFVQASPADAYREYIPAHFDKNYKYFIKKGAEPAFEIFRNKKTVLKALSDKSYEIEKFMKEKKENARTEQSLKEIIKFYNKITQ